MKKSFFEYYGKYAFNFAKVLLVNLLFLSCSQNAKTDLQQQFISTHQIVESVFEKGREHCDLDFYAGTLMLHGMSEFALLKGNETLLEEIIALFEKFGSAEIQARGNFISYEAGGSGAAYLSWIGATSKLDSQVAIAGEKMMKTQKRTHDDLMTAPNLTHHMFIDVVFAVSPFLLYAGLKFDKPEYIDYAIFQTIESFNILKDPQTGLVHQGRGFQGEGVLSADNWSRGNGWGAFALALLARDLPESHPRYQEVVALAREFFTTVIEFQNDQGLWHQEMTAPASYVETSGSGLLLHGIGVMLQAGLLDKKYLKNFERGLQGLLSYIGTDGSVSHSCFSCRCPKDGSKQTYIEHPWVYNDPHAFGPVVLAFTQAALMGIDSVQPLNQQGINTIIDAPHKPRTYIKYARGRDVAWENDRIAFRVFGPEVRDKVGSGVDVWTKSVDYPILDKWYKLNAEGKNYHEDRGEGLDFYNMGRRSGCGALAIWLDGKPYFPQTFDGYRISQNQDDKITFELDYRTWNIHGMEVAERRKIEMEKGTNLFKVSSLIRSYQDKELTIAIGLSTFGDAEVLKDKEKGVLSVWENFKPDNGALGSAVLLDPEMILGYETYDGDEFILVKAFTNIPFTYYAGAGWSKSDFFNQKSDWEGYLSEEKLRLNLKIN
jgi:rhamnogalacturonyl hydrolase YesR